MGCTQLSLGAGQENQELEALGGTEPNTQRVAIPTNASAGGSESSDWVQSVICSNINLLTRSLGDHTPLCTSLGISTGQQTHKEVHKFSKLT